MEPITINFTPTKEDYIRSGLAYMRHSSRIQFVSVLAFIVIPIMLLFGSWLLFVSIAGSQPISGLICVPLICIPLLAFVPINNLIIFPRTMNREVDAKPHLLLPITWELTDDKVFSKASDYSETTVKWSHYLHLLDAKDYYFMVTQLQPIMYQYIPKRAFESPEQEAAFCAMVEAHLGPIKK